MNSSEGLMSHIIQPYAVDPRAGMAKRSESARLFNPDKEFSGCGLETIAGLKIELGLDRVDLVGGDGRDDVNEGVDDGSMLGQIEG